MQQTLFSSESLTLSNVDFSDDNYHYMMDLRMFDCL